MAEPAADPDPAPMAEPAADPDPAPMAEPAAEPDPAPMAEPAAEPARWMDFQHLFEGARFAPGEGNPSRLRGRGGSALEERAVMGYGSGSIRGHIDFGMDQVKPRGWGGGRWTQRLSPLSDGSGVHVEGGALTGGEFDSPVTYRPIMAFDSRGGRVSQVSTDKDEELIAHVEWDGGDDGNWTAWGWWLRARGRDYIESAPRDIIYSTYDSAVFAGGPEFENDFEPLSLPETGVGRYRGTARGLFVSSVSDSGWNSGRGFGASGRFTGEFTGSVDLTMNYSDRTVIERASWLAEDAGSYPRMTVDVRVNRMEGAWRGPEDRSSSYVVQEFGASGGPAWQFRYLVNDYDEYSNVGPGATYDHAGRARGSVVDDSKEFKWMSGIPDSHLSDFATSGGVEAYLSGVLTSDGHPRSAIGMFRVYGIKGGGGPGARSVGVDSHHDSHRHTFIGAFLAPLAE